QGVRVRTMSVAKTQFPTRSGRNAMRFKAVVLGLAVLAAPACVPDYVRDNSSPVLFRIADINAGRGLTVAVRSSGTETVPVALAVRPKNPTNNVVPQVAEAVFVEQYRVRFTRTDGHNVEGVDVPFSFSGGLSTVVDIAISGTTVTIQ